MPISPTPLQREAYTDEQSSMRDVFVDLALRYTQGLETPASVRATMRQQLQDYYTRLLIIGKDGDSVLPQDIELMRRSLAIEYEFLDGLVTDMELEQDNPDIEFSERYWTWRVGLYSLGWHVVLQASIPADLAQALPALPGVDCLGGAACGCMLEWEIVEGGVNVTWLLGIKEHCILCLGFAAEWTPLFVPNEDIVNARSS